MSVHLCHVVAHPFQLHGDSSQIQLMQAGDVGMECLLGPRFDVLVPQGAIHTGGTFAHHFLQHGLVIAAEQQHIFSDILVHVVISSLVSQIDIEVFYFRVD